MGELMVWWLLASLPAFAQQTPIVPQLNAQLYRPVIDARTTLWTESTGTIVDGVTPLPRVALQYVNRPLVFVPEGGGEQTPLVSDVLQLDAIFSTAVDRFRFALDVPVYLYSAGQLTEDGPGIGDIAFDARALLVDPEEAPVGLALSGRIGFPSATVDSPLGDSAITGELVAIGEVRATDALTVLANVGTRFNPTTSLLNAEIGDQFVWRAGAGYALVDDHEAGVSFDLAGRSTYAADLANGAGHPIEALVGGWGRVSEDWVLRMGVGRGITPGIGSPQVRVIAMVTLDPGAVGDTDLDGIVDPDDACPSEPEDVDGFQDSDGCPEVDNDGDGLLDAADTCPDAPEDVDGFADADGCPDPSSQVKLVVQDRKGRVLDQAVLTVDGPEAGSGAGEAALMLHPGAYTAMGSSPGFVTGQVSFVAPIEGTVVLVLEPEAQRGTLEVIVLDEGGAPVESVVWTVDAQTMPPLQAGVGSVLLAAGAHEVVLTADGFVDNRMTVTLAADGVVNEVIVMRVPRVKVTKERIDITETIYFETNKATIKPDSHGLLDEVAQILEGHPEVTKVRIEGHTDNRGRAAYNQTLSEQRAAAVLTYLTGKGIAADRLSSVGHGESKPIDDRDVDEAWDKNRRVDFFIESRDSGS